VRVIRHLVVPAPSLYLKLQRERHTCLHVFSRVDR